MTNAPKRNKKKSQSGYALLLVLFLVSILAITALVAAPNVLTNGQREKEEEMIWRGKQYVRGIKLFYRKNGRFPKELDDLTKPKMGSLRFLRQPYKDPMNKEDGSWRLIYVGPAGQLIGSLKPRSTSIQMPAVPQIGTPASAIAAQNPNQPGVPPVGTATGSTMGNSLAPGTPGSNASGTGAPAQPGAPAGQGTDAAAGNDDQAQAAAASANGPTILGGNIIGVGSKINRRSLKIYEKAKNYRLFEFIWDPSKDVAAAIAQPPQAGVGAPGIGTPSNGPTGQPTGNGGGSQPGNGNPQPNPQPPTTDNPPQP
jgi:type II secretory pathway pseudopilin PulG